MPAKIRLNLEYGPKATLNGDLRVIWETFAAIVRRRPS
jgi:lipopolysaccharide/colanic/teichoic acid biosynthesis glycosyltransferase